MNHHLNPKQIEAFKSWLNVQGADVMKPTNEWELVRFSCVYGVGVIYTRKNNNQTASAPWVGQAVNAWKSRAKWDGKGKRVKRQGSKKAQLIARDGLECFYCGKEFAKHELTQEHLLSITHGGPDKLLNMVLACQPCNTEADCKTLPEKIKMRDEKR